jgi:tyrosyl-tRNA synthetase
MIRMTLTIPEQIAHLSRGAVDMIDRAELTEKLKLGRPLRVKFGADPSAPDLTLGHCVHLRALRAAQELGHQVVFIVGDFTAMIGDPSGRSATRPQLSREQVEANARTYVEQAGKILDVTKVEIRYNSEWLGALTPEDMIRLGGKFTVAQMLEREDFSKRFAAQAPIGIHELFYPLVQGYDSYAIQADIEIGGTDQKFNFMVGRDVQRLYGMAEQVVITRPLIPGTDGEKKMSKSLGNYIAVLDAAGDMYGKVMSIPDHLIAMYFEYLTDVPYPEIEAMVQAMKSGGMNPRDAKDRLAMDLVTQLHDAAAARKASDDFRRAFSAGQTLDDFRAVAEPAALPADAFGTPMPLARLMTDIGMTASGGEARRLIEGGAVYLDDAGITDPKAVVTPVEGAILRAGKRRVKVLVRVP